METPGRATHGAPVQPQQQPGYWTSWQLWRRNERPDALAHLALRSKSTVVLDALALASTDGRRTAAQVLEEPGAPIDPARAGHCAALAIALAGMGRTEEEMAAAAAIYEQLWVAGAMEVLAPIHHQGLAQSFFLAGWHDPLRLVLDDLTKLPPPVRHYLEVDLANPHLVTSSPAGPHQPDVPRGGPEVPHAQMLADHGRWLDLLSTAFTTADLEPVRVGVPGTEGGAEHLFDHLGAAPDLAGTATGGPLVTVIMPCFRPDEGLLTSIASISNQSWADLEILVVDDASGPEHEEIFARAVATDKRARLVRMERNGGSYLGRNAALRLARGQLVTFQDADDWSHPRRIEHQARLLMQSPGAPASRSLAVRAKDDLTHQWFGYRAIRDNASSLMVRRSVFDQIGGFAALRKGADSEYAERITALAGPVRDTGTPLAITRLRTGTLSRGDFTYQWSSPERLLFKGSYRAWHATLTPAGPGGSSVPGPEPDGSRESGQPDTSLVLGPNNVLPCPVPRSFVRGLDHHPDWDRVPVAYLGDLSTAPGSGATGADRLWRELTAGPGSGRTGLWHLEAATPVLARRPEMHPDWFNRIVRSAGRLVPLTRLEPVRVDRLVVLDPRVLLLTDGHPCRVSADLVEIELTPDALHSDGSDLPVDILAVSDACHTWWGTRPRWVPAAHLDDAARRALHELVPTLLEVGPGQSSELAPSTSGTR